MERRYTGCSLFNTHDKTKINIHENTLATHDSAWVGSYLRAMSAWIAEDYHNYGHSGNCQNVVLILRFICMLTYLLRVKLMVLYLAVVSRFHHTVSSLTHSTAHLSWCTVCGSSSVFWLSFSILTILVHWSVILQQRVKQHNTLILEKTVEISIAVWGSLGPCDKGRKVRTKIIVYLECTTPKASIWLSDTLCVMLLSSTPFWLISALSWQDFWSNMVSELIVTTN